MAENEYKDGIKIMRVKGESSTKSVGSAMAKELESKGKLIVRALGLVAVNQAIKGLAVANGFVGQKGKRILSIIAWEDITVPDREGNTSIISIECWLG